MVEGMWIHTGGYRQFRGKWVNTETCLHVLTSMDQSYCASTFSYKYEKALSMSFKKLMLYLITFLSLGMKVFVHGGAATPLPLLDALAKRGHEAQLKNVELIHIHTEAHDKVVSPEFEGN